MDHPSCDIGPRLKGSTQQVCSVLQQEHGVCQAVELMLDVVQAAALKADILYQTLRLRDDSKACLNDDVEHGSPASRRKKLKRFPLFGNTEI